ncbi:GNAT family N-acetyltransferase [Streptomyces sp. NBC_00441]|uniref:GNAT family N-acetyltransferase n=1 Tax=Streptomyces sp. NBC_00441 TaxID=2975742 RepID=UPI002E2E34AB|nr:GNAT family N-acetyltransferase [Streptomyces sp. NBC_00441]
MACFFVSTEARRRGVATELLRKATEAATTAGLTPALQVESGASAAIHVYERAGWHCVSTSPATWTTAGVRTAQMHTYVAAPDGA